MKGKNNLIHQEKPSECYCTQKMDSKSILSALSLVASATYIFIGSHTFKQNTKAKINKIFLLLCISYTIWSFAYAFAYVSNNIFFELWNKIAALGWCSFSAITLYLVLLITENKFAKNKLIKGLLFFPAILFFYMAVFLFGEKIYTPKLIINIFYIGNFLYNFLFLLLSIILILIWGIKSESKRIKIQSRILVISSSIPFCLNLVTQTILPALGFNSFPFMGQIYSVIVILGTYIVIEKYKFLKIPERVVIEEVENKIIDMVIVVNEKGELIRASSNALNMLGFQASELQNKPIAIIFNLEDQEKFTLEKLMQEIRVKDLKIIKKNGEAIPVNVNSMPIWDKKVHDFLGAAIIMQDISIEHQLRRKNEELHEKTIRDGLTKLYNHQFSVEIIKREIDELWEQGLKKELSLMMIDIDYFKKVNDTYGHLFGDVVLKRVADILMEIVHDYGYVGRFGGEEFIIILPGLNLDQAYEIAENIRNNIENCEFEENLKLSVSIGLKQYENQLCMDFLKGADDLLYLAKQRGRNRIEYKL